MARRATLTVEVPASIGDLAPDLSLFVQGMVGKLAANAHKKPPDKVNAKRFLTALFAEVLEAHEQWVIDREDPNMARELNDVANFAFLMFVSMNKQKNKRNRHR